MSGPEHNPRDEEPMDREGSKSWILVCDNKLSELDIVDAWASITGLGKVRDHIRLAKAAISDEIERVRKQADFHD